MFDTVKDYAYSVYEIISIHWSISLTYFCRKERVKETVVSYTSRSEIDKVLIEVTANESWNVPNTKLQTLADASF
jgi:hypothetical protein